jgi:hypothetical protein
MIAGLYDGNETKLIAFKLMRSLSKVLKQHEAREEFEICQDIIDAQALLSNFCLDYEQNGIEVQLLIYIVLRRYFHFHDIVTLGGEKLKKKVVKIDDLQEECLMWFVVEDEFIGIIIDDEMTSKITGFIE